MEQPQQIRQYLPGKNAIKSNCTLCSKEASVEVLTETLGYIMLQRYCKDCFPDGVKQ
jgi:hypothetical protein